VTFPELQPLRRRLLALSLAPAWLLVAAVAAAQPAEEAYPDEPAAGGEQPAEPPAEAAPEAPTDTDQPEAPAEPPASDGAEAAPEAPAGEEPPPTPETPAKPAEPPPPRAEPAPAAAEEPAQASAATAAPQAEPKTEPKDEISEPGYLPGYRRYMGLGVSPYTPGYGTFPGGITAGYGAPIMGSDWTFKFSGFMKAGLQASIDHRPKPTEGQSGTTFHTPPSAIDEYESFLSTNTVPGHWADLRFTYGNDHVSATVSYTTWTPYRSATFYQLGSHHDLGKAFLTYTPDPIGDLRIQADVGYFSNSYGELGQYGAGIYVNPIVGRMTGSGTTIIAEYDLGEDRFVVWEQGFMGARTGKVPQEVVADNRTGWENPLWPADWVFHEHLGVRFGSDPEFGANLHFMRNWSMDDRTGRDADIPFTRQINEREPKDGRIDVYGFDARMKSGTWGYLALGAAYITAEDAYTMRTLTTYGGHGENLTNSWFGQITKGAGKILVGAINYNFSLGKMVSHPIPFPGDGPDIIINTGFHLAKTWTEFDKFDGRIRHKYGIDAWYKMLPYFGAALRLDRVVPDSNDSGETFHVISPRLVFKTDWNSREHLTLQYAKWFYGPRTHSDGLGARQIDRLDDQLIAVNFDMWF